MKMQFIMGVLIGPWTPISKNSKMIYPVITIPFSKHYSFTEFLYKKKKKTFVYSIQIFDRSLKMIRLQAFTLTLIKSCMLIRVVFSPCRCR